MTQLLALKQYKATIRYKI